MKLKLFHRAPSPRNRFSIDWSILFCGLSYNFKFVRWRRPKRRLGRAAESSLFFKKTTNSGHNFSKDETKLSKFGTQKKKIFFSFHYYFFVGSFILLRKERIRGKKNNKTFLRHAMIKVAAFTFSRSMFHIYLEHISWTKSFQKVLRPIKIILHLNWTNLIFVLNVPNKLFDQSQLCIKYAKIFNLRLDP